jgi:hypothetical protein
LRLSVDKNGLGSGTNGFEWIWFSSIGGCAASSSLICYVVDHITNLLWLISLCGVARGNLVISVEQRFGDTT